MTLSRATKLEGAACFILLYDSLKMDLTSEEKLDMSLDEIIQLQWQKQNAEFKNRKLQNELKKSQQYSLPFWTTNAVRRFYEPRRQRPKKMGKNRRKYRQLQAYKSIQRAKYTLLQQYLRNRNEAYRRWEERSCLREKECLLGNNDWGDVTSNYSTCSTNADNSMPSLQNNFQWNHGRFGLGNIPTNLTIKLTNNLALRSPLNQQRLPQHRNYQHTLNLKQSPISDTKTCGFPIANRMVLTAPISIPQGTPKTLNERFTALQQCGSRSSFTF